MQDHEERSIRPLHPRAVDLQTIAEAAALRVEGDASEVTVLGLTLDSRDVRPGDLYVGMPGSRQHGAVFVSEAVARGAVAMVTNEAGAALSQDCGVPVLVTQGEPREHLGEWANLVYGTDTVDAKVLGVTGTNGKTSVVYMIDALMRAVQMKTGISTTAERRIGDLAIVSALTSPEASELHGLLARMVEEQVEGIAIEVSAQAIVRHRIDGVRFDVVAFNNFSQDHLDEFGDMNAYFQAKLGLFTPERASRGVVVVDTPEGQRFARLSQIPVVTLSTEYGQNADWHLAITSHKIDGVSFVLQGPDDAYIRARVPVFGRFMAENAALAMIMLHEAGITVAQIAQALGNDPVPVRVPGRLELMNPGAEGPRFYVDYGHTPGSFEAMLDSLSDVAEGRVIFMFGADGDRDATKREEMGRIAAEGSHTLIICDYHPRTEDPAAIRAQLIRGAALARSRTEVHEVADPREAIRFAIANAEPNDTIVYAGPGHETYQEVAGNMIPYSARDEVRLALREAGLLL